MLTRERERDRQTDSDRDTERDRDTDTDRDRNTERDGHRERQRHRDRERERRWGGGEQGDTCTIIMRSTPSPKTLPLKRFQRSSDF